jgi:hypothetical protein
MRTDMTANIRSRYLLFTVALLSFCGLLRAADDVPKSDKVTYLGVTAKPVDATLRAQLNLPDDVGLTVTSVDHKGPAAADLHVNDVLQKLDDQLLIDAHQLVTLIHLHHGGDTVTLTVIREAKPTQVTIKLGEKQRPAGGVHSNDVSDGNPPDNEVWAVPFDTNLPLGPNNQVVMSFKDDLFSACINTDKAGHKKLTVKDKSDKIVTDAAPVDTQEQWEKLSPQVREHLEVMHKMMVEQQK